MTDEFVDSVTKTANFYFIFGSSQEKLPTLQYKTT